MTAGADIVTFAGRLRNVLLVLLAVLAGLLFPEGAPYVQRATLLIVAFLVYSSLVGASVEWSRLRESARAVVVVLLISYVIVPFVGISWSRLYLPDGMLVGVAAILAAPATAGSAIVWTRIARGNEELSGIASLCSIALTPLVTPLLLWHLTGGSLSLPVVELESKLALITVLAVLLAATVPKEVAGETTIRTASVVSIALLIYAGVGTTGMGGTSLFAASRIGLVAVVVAGAGLLAGALAVRAIGGSRDDVVAVFFSGTLKNLGISLLIVLSASSREAIFAVIGYYVCQQLLSALVVDGLSADVGGLLRPFR